MKRSIGSQNIDFRVKSFFVNGQAGVYSLTFEDGSIYIGSSRNLAKRIGCYKASFKAGIVDNKRVIECVSRCKWVEFKVLCFVVELDKIKIAEDYFLNKHSRNPLILNRAMNSASNKGIRWTEEEKLKTKMGHIQRVRDGRLHNFWQFAPSHTGNYKKTG